MTNAFTEATLKEYIQEANTKLCGYGAHYEVHADFFSGHVKLKLHSTLYDAQVRDCGTFTRPMATAFVSGLLAAEIARDYEKQLNIK